MTHKTNTLPICSKLLIGPVLGLILVGVTLWFLGWTSQPIQAAGLTVCPSGCDYSSIQTAINSAAAGDTVQVYGPFSYTEKIVLTPTVSVIGVDFGTGKPVIDGEDVRGPMVTANNSSITASTVFSGFIVQRGNASGIAIGSGGPLISHNVITGNNAAGGGGIYISFGNPIIASNIIQSNYASNGGGGIYLDTCVTCSPNIYNNLIISNTTAQVGGGLYIETWKSVTVKGNNIIGNEAKFGGGVAINGTDGLVLDNNVISGIGTMPPKGSCDTCTNEELRSFVQYMLNQSK